MKIIKIKTQDEFDKLDKNFIEFTEIEIFGTVEVQKYFKNSQVTARENSQVTAWGNSCVHSYSDQNILLYGLSVCFLLSKESKAIKESENSQIIQGLIKDGKVENWLELEGIESKDDKVTLFKRVSRNFKTQKDTKNETLWEISKTITHKNWEPQLNECSEGKFHACSFPYFCDDFRNEKDDKYIAIEIKVKNLYSWPNPQYPHKISFREGKVLCECDKFGNKKG